MMKSNIIHMPRVSPMLSDARAIIRMAERERRLEAELAQLRRDRRPIAERLCRSVGFRLVLAGPQLVREAMSVIEQKALKKQYHDAIAARLSPSPTGDE